MAVQRVLTTSDSLLQEADALAQDARTALQIHVRAADKHAEAADEEAEANATQLRACAAGGKTGLETALTFDAHEMYSGVRMVAPERDRELSLFAITSSWQHVPIKVKAFDTVHDDNAVSMVAPFQICAAIGIRTTLVLTVDHILPSLRKGDLTLHLRDSRGLRVNRFAFEQSGNLKRALVLWFSLDGRWRQQYHTLAVRMFNADWFTFVVRLYVP